MTLGAASARMWGPVDAAVRCAVPLALRLLHARRRIGTEAIQFAHDLRALQPLDSARSTELAGSMLAWFENESEFSASRPYTGESARCRRCGSEEIDYSDEFLNCRRCGSEAVDVPPDEAPRENDKTLLQMVIASALSAVSAAHFLLLNEDDGSRSERAHASVRARMAASAAIRDTLTLAVYPIEGRVPLQAHLLQHAWLYAAAIRVLCDEVDAEPRLLLPASLPLLEQITDAAVARAIAWQGRR